MPPSMPQHMDEHMEDYLQTLGQPPSHDVEDVWDTTVRLSMEANAATHDEEGWQGLPYIVTRGQPAPRWSLSG